MMKRGYVRVKLTTETETGKEIPFTCFQGISEDWKLAGEYLYYTNILEPKASTEIFRVFELPADWNQEEIAKDTIQIHLQVDAIQSDHFTPDFTSESPWGNVEVQEAENRRKAISSGFWKPEKELVQCV